MELIKTEKTKNTKQIFLKYPDEEKGEKQQIYDID